MSEIELNERLFRIFMPYAKSRIEAVQKNETKFVHYTSASTGLSIIENAEVWMRNALLMNDFAEIEHGKECLLNACNDENVGVRLKAALSNVNECIWPRVCELFDGTDFYQRTGTYLISVSEHGGGVIDEDKYGRLSMWRAYGGEANVALVLNGEAFHSETDALNVFTTPVLYKSVSGFKDNFREVVENIEGSIEFLSQLKPEEIALRVYNSFFFAVLATKHPGFAEEKEWRIVHSPEVFPSERMKFKIEVIEGIPQKVYKLPLQNIPEDNLTGIGVAELLNEVIIGPNEFPRPIFDSYNEVMSQAGIVEAHKKIRLSGIPLRR